MRLTYKDIQEKSWWEERGILLPAYDTEKIAEETKNAPTWLHVGAGNIFRIFINGIAQRLIAQDKMEKGITCVVPRSFEVVDKLYKPFDNLVLGVTLKADGTTRKEVLGAISEVRKSDSSDRMEWERLKEIGSDPGLQIISFTITEKGYALKNAEGKYYPNVSVDLEHGPAAPVTAMAVTCAVLWERFCRNKAPLAIVSMDNCSHNGEKLRDAILTVAKEWKERGYVTEAFLQYIADEERISFPWTMIDKITPRPSEAVGKELEELGLEEMSAHITSGNTFMAPYVNAEEPEYLVIEDRFPNGRPEFEAAGVYMTDRDTVNKVERMKVTTCLNPLHTALAVYGCVLGYTLIADEMQDEELNRLVRCIGLVEGMPVVTDPGIISPKEFVKEVLEVRIPNPFMPDTPQRIATDTSQKVGIRYGETIKSYIELYGSAERLTAIPLAIAGWCRYLLGVDDNGNPFEMSSDPMLEVLKMKLADIKVGEPESYCGQLKEILSNVHIFGVDLYAAGIGEKIEKMFLDEIQGIGAVRATLKNWLK